MRRALLCVPRPVVLCTALLLAACADTGSSGSEGRFLVAERENESIKIGFIDKGGESVIQPQFDDGRGFSEGLAAVKVGDKWGFIDKKGRFIINPQFDGAREFSEWLARVQVRDKWGFIDKQGRFIANPHFADVGIFSEGRAAVRVGDKWGFIDKQGRYVAQPHFDEAREFSEGLAAVKVGDKWGFINKQGRLSTHLQFDEARNFSESLARVKLGDKWGFIDKQGRYVAQPQFDDAREFSEGLARVRVGDKWGFANTQGRLSTHLQFDNAQDFSESLAGVKVGDKWGFIDKQGSYVANPQFDDTQKFSEGLAGVKIGDKWGFIDKQGRLSIHLQFNEVYDFAGGLAGVIVEGTPRYIDKRGRTVWDLLESAELNSMTSSTGKPAQGPSDRDKSRAADRDATARQSLPGSRRPKPQPATGVAQANTTAGSKGTRPNKRKLPKFGPSRGRYENACERMVGLLISFPVTTGDIEDGCVCANNAIESATLPQKWMKNIVRTVAGQEYLYFAGMEDLASSSNVLQREVSLAADEMYDNVKICLGAIPLIENTYGAGSRFTTPEKMVARGTDVRPIPGPARPHFRGVGGLRRMSLETVMEEVSDIWHQRQAGQPDSIYRTLKDEYGMHSSDYIRTVRSIETVEVLECEYARANRNFISNSYYFWYESVPTGFNDALTPSLPPQHPIFAIGEARQWCPDREPTK